MEKPGGLQSIGSQRVGHDWVTELNWTDTKKKGLNDLDNHGVVTHLELDILEYEAK